MAQKDKELLLKDLAARLPYGVIVDIKYNKEHGSSDRLRICSEGSLMLNTDLIGLCIEEEIHLKPYLRPMSSMTEEEEQIRIIYERDIMSQGFGAVRIYMSRYIDWLNSKHFDWHTDGDGKTLIKKGIALKAPEGMYK